MIRLLFILSVISIPFSDFFPVLPLGEMEHELSAYLFMITISLAVAASVLWSEDRYKKYDYAYRTRLGAKTYGIAWIMFFMVLAISVSFVMNLSHIIGVDFRGRNAFTKFITSNMVVLYGFGIAYLTYHMAKKHSVYQLIAKPVAVSMVLCVIATFIEVLSWYSGAAAWIYALIAKFIHAGAAAESHGSFMGGAFGWGYSAGRAEGLSFEPPALANYCGFAWPWIYVCFSANKGKKKFLYGLLWFLSWIVIGFSVSRTGICLLIGNTVVLFLLRFIYLPEKPLKHPILRPMTTFMIFLAVSISVFMTIMYNDMVIDKIFHENNVSNISRYASNMAAYRMFADSPIWGMGFGQYGFNVKKYMPGWGYYSWEIRAWLSDPMVVWPPVFSMYARFAGELGVLGIITWVCIWLFLAGMVIKYALAYQRNTGILLKLSYPLVISCFCVLFSGIPSDSLHAAMIWITMGLSCHFIADLRVKVKQQRTSTALAYAT